jgi:hypothetical protein
MARKKLSSATSWPLLLPTAWKEIVEDSQTFGLTELKLWRFAQKESLEAVAARGGWPSAER